MDPRWRRYADEYAGLGQPSAERQREEVYEESLAEDLGLDFRLPRDHRITENLDVDNLEQASVDTQIAASNVGFKMMQKMGWKGRGLGREEQGIVEPVRAEARDAKLGVGKQEEDNFYTAEENVQRKKLEVEIEETQELREKRKAVADRESRIKEEVAEIVRPFYCALCNKQYKTTMEYETHLSSYDHNHKKRFRDMKGDQAKSTKDERMKREQLQQEKDAARLAVLAEAQRQQQRAAQGAAQGGKGAPPATGETGGGPSQSHRGALKFGFGTKSTGAAKGSFAKRPRVEAKVPSVFGAEEDD